MEAEPKLSHKFNERTGAINLKRLEHETNRLFFSGFLVAIAIHAALFSLVTFKRTTPRIMRPIQTELIIRPPRMTRPFIIPQRDAARRELRRRVIERMPSGTFQFKSLPTPEEVIKMIDDFEMVLTPEDIREMIADVIIDIDRQFRETFLDSIYREQFPEEIEVYLDKVEREAADQISMRESLLTIDNLDTGQYRGLVIKDPDDKQNVTGFIHIPSSIWGVQLEQTRSNESLYPPDTGKEAVIGLAEGFRAYTDVSMTLDAQLYLDKPDLHKYPIVYISAERGFQLTSFERENLGQYLMNGGFAMLEPFSVPAFNSLTQMVTDVLGNHVQIMPVPADHPILHCYYDFENPTVRFEGEDMLIPEAMYYLDGVFRDDELVAVILTGEYGAAWAARSFENPYFRLAVNVVVYSLIKEESVAKQYINAD